MRTRWFLCLSLLAFVACGDDDTTVGRDTGGVDGGRRDASTDAAEVDASGPVCTLDSTLGNACGNDVECNDGCFCNGVEGCVGGVCAASTRGSCEAPAECATSTCDEEADECMIVADNAICSDGDACNGIEVCDPVNGCRSDTPPYCNDEDSCTVDSCDSVTGCVFLARDLDGDGFRDGRCGGDDCDDDPRFGAMIYPGAVEDCSNRRDDNCDGIRDYSDLGCVPTNGTCATAQMLPGPGTYSGATRTLTSTVTTSCGSGSDAFFAFTLTEMQDVQITAAGGFGTAVALRTAATCAGGPDLRCNDASPAQMLQRSVPAGDYIIVVKQSSAGIFDLTLRLTPPTEIPPVDRCNAGTVDISAGGTFTGMYSEVEDDYRLSCGTTGRRDAAYRFTITEPKDVTLTGTTLGSSFPTTYISLVRDCDLDSTTVQCIAASWFETVPLRQRGLAAGTYYVLLETDATDATGWSLDVSITDPLPRSPGDACTTVVDITPPGAATTGSGTASLTMAERDTPTSCGDTSSFAKDVYFSFTLATTRDVTVTTEGAGFHYTAVSTACGETGTELRCQSGSAPVAQTYRSLPAGTYFVTVSTTLSSGTVTATVATRPPTPIPPNDRCVGAIDISGGFSSTGTLAGFEDDVIGCSGSGRVDAFYGFTLTTRKDVLVTVRRPSGGSTASHTLTLRSSCGTTTNLGCDTGNPAIISQTLDPGSYIVIVDSTSAAAGEFIIQASFFDPV